MKLSLVTNYTATAITTFDLPEGKTWDDMKTWGVKYGTLWVVFNDGTDFETETGEATFEHTDFKYPDRAEILSCDEDGFPDWDSETLAEAY